MSEKTKKITENKYSKEQILASKNLTYSKDLLRAILKDNQFYTVKEVENEINKFLKRKVN